MGIENAGKHHTDMDLDLVSKLEACVCWCPGAFWMSSLIWGQGLEQSGSTSAVYIKESLAKL